MTITIIIPFFNGHQTIERLLDSIPAEFPVIVVDDQSDVPYQSKRSNVQVWRMPEKGYFTGACNKAIQGFDTDILILNQDTYFTNQDWISFLAIHSPIYAMIGERIAGNHPAWPMGYIHGTFMFVRRDAILQVGLMNQIDYPLWGSTCEWQLRICRAGFKVFPQKHIPGFVHSRRGNIGSSIQTLLERQPEKRNLFIRTPPEISVVVTNYNYGRYLPDLVASFIGGSSSLGEMKPQTFQSFEIIIVDDVSTDDSLRIAQQLVDPYKGIRLIRRATNGGTALAANTGIAAAYGKYVTIMCADDMRESWSLEDLYRAQLANPHSFIYDGIVPFSHGQRRPDIKVGISSYDFEKLLYRNHVHASIMFPKQAWMEIGGYPAEFGNGREDWAVNIALGVKGYCGVLINADKPGCLYRREGHNRTLRNTTPADHQIFLHKLKARFPDIYNGVRPMACCGKSTAKIKPARTYKPPVVADAAGMTLLEYTGDNWGTATFYGPATGSQYRAGKSKPVVPVDPRDLITGSIKAYGLLEIKENGKQIFRPYKPVIPPPVEKVVSTVATVDPIAAEASEDPEPELITSEIELQTVMEVQIVEDPPARKPRRKKVKLDE